MKKKNLSNKVENFIESLAKNESAAVIAVSDDYLHYSNYASVSEIAAAVATILSDHLDDDNKNASTLAQAIIMGVGAFIENGSKGSLYAAKVMSKAIVKSVGKHIEALTNTDNDEDDDEDCSECKSVKTCPLPQAVKYRKEHGIRTPKNQRKSNECKGS